MVGVVRVIAAVALLCLPTLATAVQIGALETRWDWELAELRFEGNRQLATSAARAVFQTTPRPWYAPWRAQPEFDPGEFEADVARLVQLYRSRGFYRTRLGYDLELPVEGPRLVAVIYIDEDEPLPVSAITVTGVVTGEASRLEALLPLEVGDDFTEADYQEGERRIRNDLRERGYARAQIARRADVDVDHDQVRVAYHVTPGSSCRIGTIEVRGTQKVAPEVIRREFAFATAEPFRGSSLETTRARLAGLNLFRTIRIDERPGAEEDIVDLRVIVAEAQPRDVRLGLGYDSEEQVRVLASWRDYNFLGDARQLGVTARASFLRYTLVGDFLQPHAPTQNSRLRAIILAQREDENGYRLDRARLLLRAEWDPWVWFTTYLFYRIEFDSLAQVSRAIAREIPSAVPANALQSSIGVGVEFSRLDDPIDPGRGFRIKGSAEPVGGLLGGTVGFVRLTAEGRAWIPLPLDSVAALRVRLGTANPIAGSRDVPLYERFFAGGNNSVRGYDRRRVGPLAQDDPYGGRSLTEASVEFRHRFTDTISGAAFLDGAYVAKSSWQSALDRLQLGTGLGVRYRSPVGPIQLDVGIPLDRAPGDARWQLHFALGASF